ncbi:regulator of chromosome condensation 1/beta-lactamase-inhibitor protein II [Triangularia verruculosa]|uniref:Regulator of chromosome condensation 1/beta-lactamase-inhibitor protein II n=1 Tax=Triangularia verruculosa TaxID=2587418 RepID=A0AAN6X7E2_9PEZI|nr:regulator of chromosome condensation 1/beta-lactamase-inhibitor protein II [Triangularia verruculosa]
MSLYATGLNAWNQLDFTTPQKDQEPDDIFTFTCVLKDKHIDYIRPFPSYTLVYTTTNPLTPTHTSGFIPKTHQNLSSSNPHHYHYFAEASNDITVIPNHPTNPTPLQHPSLSHILNPPPSNPPITYPSLKISQLSAFATGFIALSPPPEPQVYTWGDSRFTPCLARLPSPSHPAEFPSPITDLSSLPTGPIVKIASCSSGYLLAALTKGNDLYLWGHAGRCSEWYPDIPDTPEPAVIGDEGGKDVKDVAVGQAHIIVLTTDGEVWGKGDNRSGQLGLGREVEMAKEWTRLNIDFGDDNGKRKMKGVWAGEMNSFLIVEPWS